MGIEGDHTAMRFALICTGVVVLAAAGCGRDTLVGETTYDASVTTVYGKDVAWGHGKYGEPLPEQHRSRRSGLYIPDEDGPRRASEEEDEGFAAAVRVFDAPEFRLAR